MKEMLKNIKNKRKRNKNEEMDLCEKQPIKKFDYLWFFV
jgi:hypothetical protein